MLEELTQRISSADTEEEADRLMDELHDLSQGLAPPGWPQPDVKLAEIKANLSTIGNPQDPSAGAPKSSSREASPGRCAAAQLGEESTAVPKLSPTAKWGQENQQAPVAPILLPAATH